MDCLKKSNPYITLIKIHLEAAVPYGCAFMCWFDKGPANKLFWEFPLRRSTTCCVMWAITPVIVTWHEPFWLHDASENCFLGGKHSEMNAFCSENMTDSRRLSV